MLRSTTALALFLAPAAHAQTVTEGPDARVIVTELAFDPARMFDAPGGFGDLVRIAYRGDDWGWPVYAITIRNGCPVGKPEPGCQARRRARMVRAPVPPQGAERPRWRGEALVDRMWRKKLTKPAEIAGELDRSGLDWVEAELDTCPGAMAALAKATELQWIRAHAVVPDPAPDLDDLVLHADKVRVEFPFYSRQATYDGYVAPGSPGEWATRLAAVLEPCWKPLAEPPPWRRAAE